MNPLISAASVIAAGLAVGLASIGNPTRSVRSFFSIKFMKIDPLLVRVNQSQ